jgi:hypothetical protein
VKVYRAGRRGAAFAEFGPLKEARADFVSRIKGKGSYKWKKKNAPSTEWSREMGQPALMRNLDKEVPLMGEDNAFWCKTASGAIFVLDIGEAHIRIRIPKAPAGISPSIVKAHGITFKEAEVMQLDDGVSRRIITMGYTVCKFISGTHTGSQHCPGPPAPTGGNAMDWVVQKQLASGQWVVDIDGTDRLVRKLNNSGYPEVLWRGVPSHYPNHAHTSGNPKRVGTPACL